MNELKTAKASNRANASRSSLGVSSITMRSAGSVIEGAEDRIRARLSEFARELEMFRDLRESATGKAGRG